MFPFENDIYDEIILARISSDNYPRLSLFQSRNQIKMRKSGKRSSNFINDEKKSKTSVDYEFFCKMRPDLSKSAIWNYKILKQIYARKLAIANENDVDISLDLEWHFVGQLVESNFCLRARYPIVSIPTSSFPSISYLNIFPDKIFEHINKHFF